MSVSSNTLVGKWVGTVSHDAEVDEYTLSAEADGTLTLVTAKSGGAGTWSMTGDHAFELVVQETFNSGVGQISPNGHHAAYIEITISGRLTPEGITGEGSAVVHGPDGSVIYGTDARTTARPVS